MPRGETRSSSNINHPGSSRRVLAKYRADQSLQMRLEGKTFTQIGEVLGISGNAASSTMWRALALLDEETKEKAREYRALELAKLNELEESLWLTAIVEEDISRMSQQSPQYARPPQVGEYFSIAKSNQSM